MRFYILILLVLLMFSCNGSSGENKNNSVNKTPTTNGSTTTNSAIPTYTFEVVNEYKHDPRAFTQGLVFHEGVLYEGTGGDETDDYFASSLRKVEIESGKVLQKYDLADEFFGEGIVILKDKIYQLTWRSGVGFVYNLSDFKLLQEFRYTGEGWGLTTDGTNLIMSDGTHVIRIVDPQTFKTIRTIVVKDEDGKPLYRLNELEFVKGEIWANVWQQAKIARLDPKDGKLLGWIDLTKLETEQRKKSKRADVLNGIAYDAENEKIYVTGKLWENLYEIKVKPTE